MTIISKNGLTLLFEQGDVPSGTNYADLIASQVNLAETGTQSMAGTLNPVELVTPRVSATDVNVTGTFSVNTFSAASLTVNNVNAGTVSANTINGVNITLTTVSADVVYASAGRFTGGVYGTSGIVSAAGTTQGAAAVLTNFINRGKGVADGVTTGFRPPANRTGWVQYLYNEGASANLWPPTGGTINGLAADAAFPLVASAMVTIIHLTASAMAAK